MLAALAVIAMLTMSLAMLPTPPDTATADQSEGLYIFHYSKPVAEFEVLGTLKLPGLTYSERADKCLETLIKRAKKDFPRVEALLVNSEFSKAECIKFNSRP